MSKVILITGVSSGFGRATAQLLAQQGYTVYGSLRKPCNAPPAVRLVTIDLSKPETIRQAVATIIDREGHIDVLINNAGMHSGGPAETIEEEHLRLQIETSFTGPALLTREVLPHMRRQGGGTIINISSIGGLMGLPFQPYYSAAKFAIEGFSEALRMEVKQFGIRVVVINPGDFHTNNSANRRNYLAPAEEGDPYYNQFHTTLDTIEKDENKGGKPEVLAQKIAGIIKKKNPSHHYIIASPDQKLAVLLKRLLPSRIFSLILEDHYKIRS